MRDVEPFTTPAGDTSRAITTTLTAPAAVSVVRFEKVRGRAQDILHTASRRAEPRAWLAAVTWLVDAGLHPKHLHPKAKSTALRIARDLAHRMDYHRGIVIYRLVETAASLSLSEATVKRHVAYLRELGALVWLEHGSKRNLRLPGRKYTATATIYGAVIPPAYDTAMGHRLNGRGYNATVSGVTKAGREQAVANAQEAAANRLAPPSRGGYPNVPTADLSGNEKATRTARAEKPKSPRKSILGRKVTTALYQAADRLARRLRPLHNWTQRARINELSWVLVDKVAEGCTEQQVDWWLREISPTTIVGPSWRPDRPHTYIASQLRKDDIFRQEDTRRRAEEAGRTQPNAAFDAAVKESRARLADDGIELSVFASFEDLDDETRQEMVDDAEAAYLGGDPSLVVAIYETLGSSRAELLYGPDLVSRCLTLASHANNARIHLH